jgi:hypothetical protein
MGESLDPLANPIYTGVVYILSTERMTGVLPKETTSIPEVVSHILLVFWRVLSHMFCCTSLSMLHNLLATSG